MTEPVRKYITAMWLMGADLLPQKGFQTKEGGRQKELEMCVFYNMLLNGNVVEVGLRLVNG